MIKSPSRNVKFSVIKKQMPDYVPDRSDRKIIQYFSETILKHFSMSEDLAKAIGTVVVQALTENAREPEGGGDDLFGDDFDFGGGDEGDDGLGLDLDFEESELPESSRDAGRVQEAEGPKAAPDLSEDFAELKKTMNNHSNVTTYTENYRKQMHNLFSYSQKSFMFDHDDD